MPTAPPRHCTRCGGTTAAGAQCSCSPAWSGKGIASARRSGSTRRQRKHRAAMLAEHPICARRGDEWWWTGPREACDELATIDDHIVAIAHGGDLDDPANRQGLCGSCHNIKTAAEARRGAAPGTRPVR